MWSLGIGVWWSTAASLISSLLSKLKARSTYFENKTGTKVILQEIDGAELLEKASIVTTPTAYSDGVLHSVKPEQTLGSELVTNGDFSNGDTDWVLTTPWSISDGKAFYDFSTTGFLRQFSVFNGVIGTVYRINFDVSDTTGIRLGIKSGNTFIVQEVFTNGSYSFVLPVLSNDRDLRIYGNSSSGSIDNISIKEAKNADFTFTRNDAGTRVNASGNIESIGVDLPRIDYRGGSGSLLLEPGATNTATDSNDFTAGHMFDTTAGNPSLSNAILTSAQATSPDGTNNAWKFVDDNNGGTAVCSIPYYGQRVTADNYNTVSLFVKKQGNNDWFHISLAGWGDEVSGNTWFDIANGTLGTVNSNHTASIDDYGNGWYRISFTFQATTDTQGSIQLRLATSDGGQTILRNGTNGAYIYGLQAESDATREYATSYIPTSGDIQTRAADSSTDAGSSDLISSTEGVFYLEVAALTSINNFQSITLSNGGVTERIRFLLNNTENRISVKVDTGNGIGFFRSVILSDVTAFNKIAIKYKQDDYAIWVNGVSESTITSAAVPTLNELNFTSGGDTGSPFQGKVKCVAVFKEALTDAELTALTS